MKCHDSEKLLTGLMTGSPNIERNLQDQPRSRGCSVLPRWPPAVCGMPGVTPSPKSDSLDRPCVML